MKHFVRAAALLALLFTGVSAAHSQISVGIRIGPPPPPRVVRVHPPRPGSDYIWVDGYWYPVDGRYRWHEGYWTRPPYEGSRWVGPHYEGNQFYEGYWEGDRGRLEHHHDWDRDKNRDYDRYRGDDRRDDRERHHDDDDRDRH